MDNSLSSDQQEHPFAPFIRILGKGKTGTRALTRDEARTAFGMILRGEVEPVQLGAFLMLLRVKEETAEELVGFVEACRAELAAPPLTLKADLDWSCYAGKKHQHPWYILAIRLLAQAGYRVFLHGSAGHTAGRLYTQNAFHSLGLPIANSWDEVDRQLDNRNITYLPLQHFLSPLNDMMQMRPLLGLRSPVNTLARLINPTGAQASIQSVFHPAYAQRHQNADSILQQPSAMVFKGESGEIEVKPNADSRIHFLHNTNLTEFIYPREILERPERVATPSVEPLRELWCGNVQNQYGELATLSTTAMALKLLQPYISVNAAQSQAAQLWHDRDATEF